jgi:hypothetical protein
MKIGKGRICKVCEKPIWYESLYCPNKGDFSKYFVIIDHKYHIECFENNTDGFLKLFLLNKWIKEEKNGKINKCSNV